MKALHVSCLLLLFLSLAATDAYSIEIINFSEEVELEPLEDGRYIFPGGAEVRVTNRLIAKVAVGVDMEDLKEIDPDIVGIQQVYVLKEAQYVVVTLAEESDLADMLKRLRASLLVMNVQPDLLVLTGRSGSRSAGRLRRNLDDNPGIQNLWRKSRGENVRIAVIDDGYLLEHEDLAGVEVVFAYDADNRTLDPRPKLPEDGHGTKVAGIIFAQHNDRGIDGIAPRARFIAIRHTDTWTSKTLLSFYLAKKAGADVINCSWKPKLLLEPVADAIEDLTTHGREGRGIVLVFAAGNEGMRLAAEDDAAALARVITAGAVDDTGKREPFSNYGEHVDIYAPGHNLETLSKKPQRYVSFSGTSAAAAMVSGVAGLMLSANSDLTLGDVQARLEKFFHRANGIDDG